MRKLLVATHFLACAALLFGCSLLKKNAGADASAAADAAPDDAATAAAPDDAAAAAPTAVTAKNTADVARFPGETAATGADKLGVVTVVRTSPKGGAVVATLQAGADVTRVAEYQSSDLVTFADPKDASSTLLGWVGKEAFTAVVVKHLDGGVHVVDAGVIDPKKLTCPSGTIGVLIGSGAACKKRCTKDAECKGGKAGACAPASTVTNSVAKVCVND